jgi:putrescine transport system ATP-binding protein
MQESIDMNWNRNIKKHSDSPTPIIEAQDVQVSYGKITVLDSIAIRILAGNTLVILGNSGCGKTTLLKVLAGCLLPQAGQVRLQGQDLYQVAASQRRIIYLDQESLLFEHLNVYENIAFALRLRKCSSSEVDVRVQQMLSLISLSEHAKKKSYQLSGGQKQRVAFARAILAEPRVLLLDEPFCSLDDPTRTRMQELYKKLCHEFQITAAFVTHDVKEALVVGDSFGYMDQGKLHTHTSRDDFMQDPRTGVMQEIEFWNAVQTEPKL